MIQLGNTLQVEANPSGNLSLFDDHGRVLGRFGPHNLARFIELADRCWGPGWLDRPPEPPPGLKLPLSCGQAEGRIVDANGAHVAIAHATHGLSADAVAAEFIQAVNDRPKLVEACKAALWNTDKYDWCEFAHGERLACGKCDGCRAHEQLAGLIMHEHTTSVCDQTT